MNQPQTTGQLIDTAERRRFVLGLRKAGATYTKIAEAALRKFGINQLPKGWDERYAWKDVKRELDKLHSVTGESAEDIRQMELERLNDMLNALYDEATGIDPDHGAIDRVLKIMKRRADLLGLDAPQKQQITGADDGPVEIGIREVVIEHPKSLED